MRKNSWSFRSKRKRKNHFFEIDKPFAHTKFRRTFYWRERPGVITKQHISYLPDQTIFPKWMKISDLFSYYDDFFADFDKNKAEEMLKRLDIVENMRLKHMSKGTQEKVQLILTMSRNANLYCLDEPIGGVDPATRDYILQTIISNYSEKCLCASFHTSDF